MKAIQFLIIGIIFQATILYAQNTADDNLALLTVIVTDFENNTQ